MLDERAVLERHTDLPQFPVSVCRDDVTGQRVEQLVGKQDALAVVGQGCRSGHLVSMRREHVDLRRARRLAGFDENEPGRPVGVGMSGGERVEHIACELPVGGTGLDEIECRGAADEGPHLRELLGEQLAEQRAHIDAGEEMARASGLPGRAGVEAEARMVETQLHERGERHGAESLDALSNERPEIGRRHPSDARVDYSLRAVTKISCPRRQIRKKAARPDSTR